MYMYMYMHVSTVLYSDCVCVKQPGGWGSVVTAVLAVASPPVWSAQHHTSTSAYVILQFELRLFDIVSVVCIHCRC